MNQLSVISRGEWLFARTSVMRDITPVITGFSYGLVCWGLILANCSGVQAQNSVESIINNCEFAPNSTRFLIKEIQVLGSTVLQTEIKTLTELLENREVTFEELICLRAAINDLYLSNGYITSGAFLPNNQDISNGIVQIQIVEGEVERLEIQGLTRLKNSYIRSRLATAISKPLNQKKLQSGLALLQLNPLITQVQAELTTGSSPGSNILIVNLQESDPFQLTIGGDNYRPPNIGSEEATIAISHDNLLGLGDRVSGEYAITEGLDLYNLHYTVPLNSMNGTIGLHYWNTDSQITRAIFDTFDIQSQTETFGFEYRQPVVLTPQTEWTLGLNLDLRRTNSSIEDTPFCFSLPCQDGESKITVLRFSQEWLNRGSDQVFAARSQFNFGLDIFDATSSDTETDEAFFSWLGQFQWVKRVNDADWLILTRFFTQLTPDSLPIIEKFSLGGIDTVRGYGQNQLVTDNALLASVELRIPLTEDSNLLQLTPFIEGGTGWNNLFSNPDPSTLVGIGLGLRLEAISNLVLQLDYGIPLVPLDERGDSAQEQGFYFSLRYTPF